MLGVIDIIYILGWVSNIDMMWTEARLTAFLTGLNFAHFNTKHIFAKSSKAQIRFV